MLPLQIQFLLKAVLTKEQTQFSIYFILEKADAVNATSSFVQRHEIMRVNDNKIY